MPIIFYLTTQKEKEYVPNLGIDFMNILIYIYIYISK